MTYEQYLYSKLYTSDLKIEIADEQMFAKKNKLEDDTVYVVIKYLSSTITFEGKTQPIQIMVMSENNQMNTVLSLLNTFTATYNWTLINETDLVAKQQYTTPVVVSNFNDVSNGYRSLIYISGTLFIMNEVLDATDIKLNNVGLKVSGFTYSYNMNTNTQQKVEEYISSSVKSNSVVSVSFVIPLQNIFKGTSEEAPLVTVDETTTSPIVKSKNVNQEILNVTGTYVDIGTVTDNGTSVSIAYALQTGHTSGIIKYYTQYNLIKDILNEMAGISGGNNTFALSFSIGDVSFSHNMKLTSAHFTTSPDGMPAIQIGLTR